MKSGPVGRYPTVLVSHPKRSSRKRRSPHVPGQYRGYSLQADRFLVHLLRSKRDATVSLEVIGDTGVYLGDGRTLSEESKSRGGTRPVSDRSIEVWKTLRNWADAATSGRLDAATTDFRLYVSRPVAGTLLQRFADAATPLAARSVLRTVQEELGITLGLDGRAMIPPRTPRGLREHLATFFDAPAQVRDAIIANFSFEAGSGAPTNDLRAEVDASLAIPSECANDVLTYLMGWLKDQIDARIDRGQAVCIRREDFKTAMHSVIRKFDQRGVLYSVASAPTDAQRHEHLSYRTYVEQLELIAMDEEEQLRAVTAFIRAEADRTEWSERGRVFENDFVDFETALKDLWSRSNRRGSIVNKHHSEVERGQLLYFDCCEQRVKLGGAEVPEHFCAGSLHKLADTPEIGWHPQYKRLLKRRGRRSIGARSPGAATRAAATNALDSSQDHKKNSGTGPNDDPR
jgi:hypothetical protein